MKENFYRMRIGVILIILGLISFLVVFPEPLKPEESQEIGIFILISGGVLVFAGFRLCLFKASS